MLELPGLTIYRAELQEADLVVKARQWLAEEDLKRAPGIHASDLLDPRLAYWRRMSPVELTERQIWFFLIGRILHHFVLTIADPSTAEGATDGGTKVVHGIAYSPDHNLDGSPVELKTNRSMHEPGPDKLVEQYHNYLEQLLTYMALEGVDVGYLWILFINLKEQRTNRTFPEPRCYRVQVQPDGRAAMLEQLHDTRASLEAAIHARSHTSLPLCRTWLCGDSCSWWEACRPAGRFSLPRREWRQ